MDNETYQQIYKQTVEKGLKLSSDEPVYFDSQDQFLAVAIAVKTGYFSCCDSGGFDSSLSTLTRKMEDGRTFSLNQKTFDTQKKDFLILDNGCFPDGVDNMYPAFGYLGDSNFVNGAMSLDEMKLREHYPFGYCGKMARYISRLLCTAVDHTQYLIYVEKAGEEIPGSIARFPGKYKPTLQEALQGSPVKNKTFWDFSDPNHQKVFEVLEIQKGIAKIRWLSEDGKKRLKYPQVQNVKLEELLKNRECGRGLS